MRLATTIHALHPKSVFRISRAHRTEVRNVFVQLEGEGITGHGEASPNSFYNENADDVQARLQQLAPLLEDLKIRSVEDIARTWDRFWHALRPSRAAQCALDIALWDWLAHKNGCTICELAWGHLPRPIPTFVTIGISTPEELESKAAELKGYPFIKMKSDATADLQPVQFVHSRTAAALAIDANCAWAARDIPTLATQLAALGVKFLEQPLPPLDNSRMPRILAASPLPILADESCVILEDVECMPGAFSGFNIKLTKCGGITPALKMLRRARELGLQTMVGCMLESSVLISAGAVIAQQTDYADLDGAWLIRDDPYTGVRYETGILHLDGPAFPR